MLNHKHMNTFDPKTGFRNLRIIYFSQANSTFTDKADLPEFSE